MDERGLKRGKYHPLIFYVFMILGALLIGIIIFNSIILPLITGGDIIIVPEITGLTLKRAEEECKRAGLNLIVVGQKYSDEFPQGFILEQDPEPPKGLKRGRAIKVVLSNGPKREVIPELKGSSLKEAEVRLKSAGFRVGRVARVFTDDKVSVRVLETFPPGGTEARKGMAVDILLVVGGEKKRYMMPNLVGMDFPFAREVLDKMGFHITKVVREIKSGEFPDKILSQNPEAGELIEEGGSIELVVSAVE